MSATSSNASVRYIIDDVDAAVAFYTGHLDFRLAINTSPAFASVTRGNLRLLLVEKKALAGERCLMGRNPFPAVGIASIDHASLEESSPCVDLICYQ